MRFNYLRRFACASLFLLCFGLHVRAADIDGPYVLRNAAGKLEAWSVEATPDGARKRVASVAAGAKLVVSAVGDLPAFTVTLRPPADIARDVVATGAKIPLFVVADTHGEFEILAGMLQQHRVIDDKLHWSFGRGQLVFLGDVFDRGAHQTEILWLIYALEAEARKAGGAVPIVLGNHETMVMRGDLRYLNPRYVQTTAVLGVGTYAELFGASSVLGQWLRSKPAVLKLNDLLCLHGGISPELVAAGYTLAQINTAVRAAMDATTFGNKAEADRAEFLFGPSGPLWYRGYFPEHAGANVATADDIGSIRQHFGVGRILVGHTTVPTITPLYGGQVIAVQVYPRRSSFGNVEFEALLIRDGGYFRAKPDGTTERLIP
jgi:hypothetical protein